MSKPYRYYQEEADLAIYNELQTSNKCLVKMFCGTGKSLLMRRCKSLQNKPLVVFVFPSLSLITQFNTDYLFDVESDCKLNVSSEAESTTDPLVIREFLSRPHNKIICVTYQSFGTLLDNLCGHMMEVCVFDEAHHAVGQTYQKLIFENDCCQQQIFFTATPKNANGIVMYDRHHLSDNMCGNMVYDYSYLKGVFEGYLNPFEIRIDLFSENTNRSLFESIARAIMASGNARVLTFHADVNTGRDTSVNTFVDEKAFKKAFKDVRLKEFPNSTFKEKHIRMIALSSNIDMKMRDKILRQFDDTPDDHIIIISSCETIGEGIDTKRANMCVFVDPKSSYVKIIQNIGRIVRKTTLDAPNSTVLIPCWVDKDKYIGCDGDKDKCDEIIRQDMAEGGNFNGILNVMSALRQEDEDIYDICLHYPDSFSPQEIQGNLQSQGFVVDDVVGEGGLMETCEYLLDEELDCEDCDTEEEMMMAIAENHDVCVEVHTHSLENPVERYNPDAQTVIRLYKGDGEMESDENDTPMYQPIVEKEGGNKRTDTQREVKAPNRNKRTSVKVHTNPDIKVLWKIRSDITKDICSCVLDCEVVDTWFERFDELKTFMDENTRKPLQKSKDKKEKTISQWFSHQQQNYKNKSQGMKNQNRYNLWTQFLEDYKEYIRDFDDIWMTNYNESRQFAEINKRFPSVSSKDEKEKNIGSWFSYQQQHYKNKLHGMKDETRYNLWTQLLENYKYCTKDDVWMTNYNESRQFAEMNKRFPSTTSKDVTEKKLGRWFSNQQKNYKKKTEGMKDETRYNLWTQLLEDYKYCTKDDVWMTNYNESIQFAEMNKRFPSETSKDLTEKKLGQWFSRQQKLYKKKTEGMKDEIRYNLWTQLLEDFKNCIKDFNDIWMNNYNESRQFAEINKRFPSCHSKYVTEKILGQWFSNQQKNYKKKTHGMKDETRYNLWTQLLEDYKDCIRKRIDKDSSTVTSSLQEEFIMIPKKKKPMTLRKQPPSEKETTEQKRTRVKSQLSELHQRYKTLKSSNLHQTFNEDASLWHAYHQISEENEQSFPEDEIPRNRIIQELQKIKTKRQKVVVDMGCGKAQIAEYYKDDPRFTFINYDHVAANDTVTVCDISNLPLDDDSVEICILSLAMWGSNCREYIMEANRVLESNGKLYMIEPTKRWSNHDESGNLVDGQECVKLKTMLLENGFKLVEESIAKFSLLVCIKM